MSRKQKDLEEAGQQSLFDPPRKPRLDPQPPVTAPYIAHSETSRAAARSFTETDLNNLQQQVLACVRQAGYAGRTDEEITTITGLNPSTVRPRRVELANKGFIKACGQRATKSGRKALVWKVI